MPSPHEVLPTHQQIEAISKNIPYSFTIVQALWRFGWEASRQGPGEVDLPSILSFAIPTAPKHSLQKQGLSHPPQKDTKVLRTLHLCKKTPVSGLPLEVLLPLTFSHHRRREWWMEWVTTTCSWGRTLDSNEGTEKEQTRKVHMAEKGLPLYRKAIYYFMFGFWEVCFSFLPSLLPTVIIMAPSEKLTYLFES